VANVLLPSDVLSIPAPGSTLKLGVIDTQINLSHPSLTGSTITQQGFEERKQKQNNTNHGTAVASILVGDSDNYQGVLKNTHLYSGSVFFELDNNASISTTESLIRAMDWQVSNGVNVINLSLASKVW
jgi:subtilisin family serine protease